MSSGDRYNGVPNWSPPPKWLSLILSPLQLLALHGVFRFLSFCIGRCLPTLVFCMATHVVRINTHDTQSHCERQALADINRCIAMKSDGPLSEGLLIFDMRMSTHLLPVRILSSGDGYDGVPNWSPCFITLPPNDHPKLWHPSGPRPCNIVGENKLMVTIDR